MMRTLEESLQAAVTALQDMVEDPLITDGVVLQQLLATAVNAYAARCSAGDSIPPFPSSHLTKAGDGAAVAAAIQAPEASNVCVTVSAMLNAVSVEVFELAMWQAWTGH
jgi:hypothetical protein